MPRLEKLGACFLPHHACSIHHMPQMLPHIIGTLSCFQGTHARLLPARIAKSCTPPQEMVVTNALEISQLCNHTMLLHLSDVSQAQASVPVDRQPSYPA